MDTQKDLEGKKPEVKMDKKVQGPSGSLGVLLSSYADTSSDLCDDDKESQEDNGLSFAAETDKEKMDKSELTAIPQMTYHSKSPVEIELEVDDFIDNCHSEGGYRFPVHGMIKSDTEDSELDSEEADSKGDSEDYEEGSRKNASNIRKSKAKVEGLKVKGELGLDDLPPIEDLHVSVPHEGCKAIGVIKSVVDPLVIVEAYPETPALNLESVLFLEEGDRVLGRVFDVIGPVRQPNYCVRFNSKEHIDQNKVEVGMEVYCAPSTPYTNFVFLAQLKKLRGSDASWENDLEPPQEELEFSDDEMERFAKKKTKSKRRLRHRALPPTMENVFDNESSNKTENDLQLQRGRKRNSNNSNPIPRVPGFGPPWISRMSQTPYFNLGQGPNHHNFQSRRGRGSPSPIRHHHFRPPHHYQQPQWIPQLTFPPPPGPPIMPFQFQYDEPGQCNWLPPSPQSGPSLRLTSLDFNFGNFCGQNLSTSQETSATTAAASPPLRSSSTACYSPQPPPPGE